MKINLSIIKGMCSKVFELAEKPEIEETDAINLCSQILGMSHWLMQSSFVNMPDPKPPERMKELQEE